MSVETIENEISIADIIQRITSTVRYLLSNWISILLVGIAFAALGIFYAWSKKPIYVAELSFVTEGEGQGGIGAYAGIAAQFGLDIGGQGGSAFEGENLIDVLKSRYLIERTLVTPIEKESNKLLVEYLMEANEGDKKWTDNPKLQGVKFQKNNLNNNRVTDSVLKSVYSNIIKGVLEIEKPEKKLDRIILKVTSGDELFSKRFSELLMENAIEFYTDIKSKKSKDNIAILQRQTDSVRNQLYGNITQVAASTDLNVNPARQIIRTSSQKSQMNAQANAALYAELVKNLELAKITTRRQTPLVQIIDYPKMPLDRKKPGRLLMGILFSIGGTLLYIGFLLLRRWYKIVTGKTIIKRT